MREIFTVAQRGMQVTQDKQVRHYNPRNRDWRRVIGQLVLVKEHTLSNAAEGMAAKLSPRYERPYRVNKFILPVIIVLCQMEERET